MAWCPFAERVYIDTTGHAAINPEVVVLHSVAGSGAGAVSYFSGGATNLQSHFVIGEDGHIWQLVDTEVAAYANFDANWYGISMEHGNVRADGSTTPGFNADHWGTPEQVASSVKVIGWCCDTHGIARKKATSARSGGVGYHRQFPEWSGESAGHGSTDCPGDTRVAEFDTLIIGALTGGTQGDLFTMDQFTQIMAALKTVNDNVLATNNNVNTTKAAIGQSMGQDDQHARDIIAANNRNSLLLGASIRGWLGK